MSAPKSVVKIDKDGIKYVSNVDFCQYSIKELTRAAFRDVAKLIKRRFREKYYSVFKKHTGKAGRVTYAKVWASESTIKPRLEIGLPHAGKGRKVEGFYGYFQELGSSKTPKMGLLRQTVEENISDIVKIESQYLSALKDEAEVLNLINEADYEEESGDE